MLFFFDVLQILQFPMKIVIICALLALTQVMANASSSVDLYVHSWCPPCKKAQAIFQRLQKTYPAISFAIHKYSNRTQIISKKIGANLPFPSISFNCNGNQYLYQNDLSFSQLSYWIEVVCLNVIPACSQKINEELYRILMKNVKNPSPLLLQSMLQHPHIKVCSSPSSNITEDKVIETLKATDQKSLYFDYFSNNLRNYLIQSNKLAIAIITPQKNTTRVNSYLQSYISLGNFMNEEFNQTKSLYRFQLPEQYKQKLVFLELCYNQNISKCIYHEQRKLQVQNNRKMIERLLHFFDLQVDNLANFQQIVAFRFDYPTFQRHIYHNLGIIDEKFMFWINEILSKKKSKENSQLCYWNAVIHRISDNNLEDIETHLILSRFIKIRNENSGSKHFSLNKIISNYQSEPKLTLCFEGQKPLTFSSNKQLAQIQRLISNYDEQSTSEQL